MTFNALLTAALRFQRRHILGRTVAVAVGLVMVVATLELQGALTRGVAQAPADLGPATSVIVRSPAAFGIFGEAQRPGLPVETIESVAGVAGVERAEGDDQGTVGVVVDGNRSEAVLGTWFEDEGLRRTYGFGLAGGRWSNSRRRPCICAPSSRANPNA